MIFSGHVQFLRCSACGREYSCVTPTSVLPMLAIVVLGTLQWIGVLSVFAWHKAVVVLVAILSGILFPIGLLLLVGLWGQWRLTECPKCGSKLAVVGGGFYDGCVPGPAELVIYVAAVAVPYVIGKSV